MKKSVILFIVILCGSYASFEAGYYLGWEKSADVASENLKGVMNYSVVLGEAHRLEALVTRDKVVKTKNFDVISLMTRDDIRASIDLIESKGYSTSPFKNFVDSKVFEAKEYLDRQ